MKFTKVFMYGVFLCIGSGAFSGSYRQVRISGTVVESRVGRSYLAEDQDAALRAGLPRKITVEQISVTLDPKNPWKPLLLTFEGRIFGFQSKFGASEDIGAYQKITTKIEHKSSFRFGDSTHYQGSVLLVRESEFGLHSDLQYRSVSLDLTIRDDGSVYLGSMEFAAKSFDQDDLFMNDPQVETISYRLDD